MTTEEDVGHLPPLVVGGAGVDRWREEASWKVSESALAPRRRVTPGSRAHHGIYHDSSWQLTAREDVVPDGDLTRDEVLTDALVDPLVVAAEMMRFSCRLIWFAMP